MKILITAGLLAIAQLIAGCMHVAVKPPDVPFFADAQFKPSTEVIDADAVFAMSTAMAHFVDRTLVRSRRQNSLDHVLQEALYERGGLKLEYDSASTRTASEAFAARAGNCLSLVLMTAAIAKRLELPVLYQRVYTPHSWSRSNGIAYASEHVNLVLARHPPDPRFPYDGRSVMTVDFLPPEETAGQRTRIITEETVVAMFFNNRAAEALAGERLDAAYAWAKAAIEHSPTHLNAYNTLAVIYLQRGLHTQARQVLTYVLEYEPANTLALSNLATALEGLGLRAQATHVREQLAAIEPTPPFHYYDLGIAEMQAGNFQRARDLFRQELGRDAFNHEFHYRLALSELAMGDEAAARRGLSKAAETSSTLHYRGIYMAKLDVLDGKTARAVQ